MFKNFQLCLVLSKNCEPSIFGLQTSHFDTVIHGSTDPIVGLDLEDPAGICFQGWETVKILGRKITRAFHCVYENLYKLGPFELCFARILSHSFYRSTDVAMAISELTGYFYGIKHILF